MIGRMSRCTPSRLTSGPLPAAFAPGDLVDFVHENDAALLDALDGDARHAVHVDQLALFFLHQIVECLGHFHAALPRAALNDARQHVLDVDVDLLDRRPRDDLERRKRALAHVDIDRAVIEAPVAQLLAEFLARVLPRVLSRDVGYELEVAIRRRLVRLERRARRRQQQIEQPLFGVLLGLAVHFLEPLFADHIDGQLDEIAHHRLDVAADVADLGELRRFDLDERRLRQARETPRDLGLPDARRPDHQDVLRHDFLGKLGRELLPAHAVAQRDGDRALRVFLPDDVFVELGDDLARRQCVGCGGERFRKRYSHQSSSIARVLLV